jgi:DMSO/TMAO reductase YedYZ molybdopterin-dependent catalytic subunit
MSLLPNDDPKYQASAPATPEGLEDGIVVSPDTRRKNRIPPGQARTRKWPVLHWDHVPTVPLDKWQLEINGLVDSPLRFNWDEFQKLPRVRVFADFHCVTRWSRLGNVWEGVAVRELLRVAGVKSDARFVVATGYDSGWTTNLPLSNFDSEDALIADRHDGEPIDADHGGPARLIVPQLYAWKSAKWLKAITLVAEDEPGYWERLGYHNHGDPWAEERYTE